MARPCSSLVVLGGCGRVGTRFVDGALDSLASQALVSVDRISPPADRAGVLELIGDVARPSAELVATLRGFESVDLVVLSALIVDEKDGLRRMEDLLETNALGAITLARECRSSLRKVVFASSVEVYGPPERGAPFSEGQILRPTTAYGVSKLAGEVALAALCLELDVPCVTLRFTSIYGSAPPLGNALEGFFELASRGAELTVFGDGSARRDFLHVDDAARAISAALIYAGSGAFNVAHAQSLTLLELASLAVKTAGTGSVVLAPEHAAMSDRVMDTARMTTELGFQPAVDAAEGMRRLSVAGVPTRVQPGR